MNYEKYFHEHLYYIHACTIKKHSCPQKIICVRIYTYCVRVYEMMFMTFFCSSLLPYALNNNRIFQIVKNLNKVSIVKVILYISNFQPKKILLPSSVPVQYQLSPIWTETCIIITVRPTPPRASIFEPLLDYIGSWNLVWKLYSTQLGQLGN